MSTLAEWLARGASWRCAALLFQSPAEQTRTELGRLAAEMTGEFQEMLQQLADWPLNEWVIEFHRVLGPAGIPACESSYDENPLAGRGPLLARIAGFYQAFAYTPDPAVAEVPDHLAVELGFLSYLSLKIAFALHESLEIEREVAEEAYDRFLSEHFMYWWPRFAERLSSAQSPFFDPSARLVASLAGTTHASP